MQHKRCVTTRGRTLIPALSLLIVLALAGCSAATPAPSAALAPTKVRVQLSWTHTIEWAGLYAAQEKGYYADESLDVELIAGGNDEQGNYIDSIQRVLNGDADFGVNSGGNLLEAREKHEPIVAIASIYQLHPLAFTSLAEKNITKPQDLIGKTIQIYPDSKLLLEAMLRASGVDPAQVETADRSDFTVAPLVSGEVDVIDAFITNEPVSLKLQGRAVNNILPVEYGIEEYPNVIFTTEKMIAEQPQVVERFLRATLKGTDHAIADPQNVAALAVRYDSSLDLAKETEAMFQSVPLLKPTGSHPGMMNDKTWETTYRIFRNHGILKQEQNVKSAYTLAFLNKIYEATP